jgi:hypothetical protein
MQENISLVNVLRRVLKKAYLRSFGWFERAGVHVTPVHFYMPIPDTRELAPSLWNRYSEMIGVRVGAVEQRELLSYFVARYRAEYNLLPFEPTDVPHQYWINNDAVTSVDGEILYCMVRDFKPQKILEIGSGKSTYLMAQAVRENGRANPEYSCDFTVIDPYPNGVVRAGFPGLTEVIPKKVQSVPLDRFTALGKNDILFIDSSHVLAIGSDVQYEFLELIPRLQKGVLVHIHDIFLPSEYPQEWIRERCFFWTEQYLLQAFMAFNESFEVLWAGHYMHTSYSTELQSAFKSYNRKTTLPGSFWIRRVR